MLASTSLWGFERTIELPWYELPFANFASLSDPDDEIGGGWIGNGGDYHQSSQNIWFLGNKTIRFCIESSQDYPLSESELKDLVQESIGDWKSFFAKYGLDNNKIVGGFPRPRFNRFSFMDGKNRGLNLNFRYGNCGNEKLKFFFGKENKLITTYKKIATEHPFGLALRKSYNHKTFSNQGLIWIANFSSNVEKIKHTLLHELGHIFGMKHNSVFVMEENLGEFLSKGSKLHSNFLGQIETDSWWYRILEDRPLILSSRRGRRQRRLLGCQDTTFNSNKLIPIGVIKKFRLNRNDCHRITLTLKSTVEGRKVRKKYELKIEEFFSKKVISLFGFFRPSKGVKPSFPGPGLYTQFKVGPRVVWKRLPIDKSIPDFPKTGAFNFRGQKLPAKMTSNKGVVIEMFIPGFNRWWTLKTVFNN